METEQEQTVVAETPVTPKRKGRPVGATSFTVVTLSELAALLESNDEVTVGKIWWDKTSKEKLIPEEKPLVIKDTVVESGEVYF